jgi:hypothetical protein
MSSKADWTIVFPQGECHEGVVLINAIDEVASIGSTTERYTKSVKSENQMYN